MKRSFLIILISMIVFSLISIVAGCQAPQEKPLQKSEKPPLRVAPLPPPPPEEPPEEYQKLTDIVPPEGFVIDGWALNEKVEFYDHQDLLKELGDYARFYSAYGFKKMAYLEYTNAARQYLVIRISDMGSNDHAYGMFSFNRTPSSQSIDVGTQGITIENGLYFFKANFYVTIDTSDFSLETKAKLPLIAGEIADTITGPSRIPALVNVLPTEDIVENSYLFFTKKSILDQVAYFTDNVLGLRFREKGVLARYQSYGKVSIGFVVEYPASEIAARQYRSYKDQVKNEGMLLSSEDFFGPNVFSAYQKGGTYSIIFQYDKYMGGVWNISDRQWGKKYINQLKDNLKTIAGDD